MSAPTDTDRSPRHKRRWLLLSSLALNVFLIGFLAVGVIRQHSQEEGPRAFREMMLFMRDSGQDQRFLRHLSDVDAQAMRRLRGTYGPTLQANRLEAQAARQAVREALLAGPGNEAAIRAAMAELRAARLRSYETFEPFLIDLGQGLSEDALDRIVGDRNR